MSGNIPREFINDVIDKIDIVDLISERLTLKKSGNNHFACCPFHNEKSPSFSVSETKQIYHCFGCGVSGNVISFLMEHDRLTFIETIETLALRLGLTIPHQAKNASHSQEKQQTHYELLQNVADFYAGQLPKNKAAAEYIKSRGLDQKTCQQFLIGYAPENWDSLYKHFNNDPNSIKQLITNGLLIKKNDDHCYDRFRDRIMIPIRDGRGRVIAFGGRSLGNADPKYLNSPETPLFHKGRELYALEKARLNLRREDYFIIVEGYMDVIALHQFGIENSVATLGTAATTEHIRKLLRYSQTLVFCFDGDNAGQSAAWRALENCLPMLIDGVQIRFAFLPTNEDPDSIIRHHGVDAFKNYIQQAETLTNFILQRLNKDVDLTQLDSKARMASLAAPLLKKMPESMLKGMFMDELTTKLRIDPMRLQQLVGTNVNTERQPTRPVNTPHDKTLTPMRLAIAIVLQHPTLLHALKNPDLMKKIHQLTVPGSDLLQALVELLLENPQLSTAAVLENWRDTPTYNLLAKLANHPLMLPKTGLQQEYLDIIKHLQQQQTESEVEQLLQKLSQTGLSEAERARLQQLIVKKNTISSMDQ